jgi:hypothetical protein
MMAYFEDEDKLHNLHSFRYFLDNQLEDKTSG